MDKEAKGQRQMSKGKKANGKGQKGQKGKRKKARKKYRGNKARAIARAKWTRAKR